MNSDREWAKEDIHRMLVAALDLQADADWDVISVAVRHAGRRAHHDEWADWLETAWASSGKGVSRGCDEDFEDIVADVRCGLGPTNRRIK